MGIRRLDSNEIHELITWIERHHAALRDGGVQYTQAADLASADLGFLVRDTHICTLVRKRPPLRWKAKIERARPVATESPDDRDMLALLADYEQRMTRRLSEIEKKFERRLTQTETRLARFDAWLVRINGSGADSTERH